MAAPILDSENKTDLLFKKWFQTLPEQATTVRLFDRKTCYSVHGEHAFTVARHLYKSTAQVTYIGGQEDGLPGVTISNNLFGSVVKYFLIEQGECVVEAYEGSAASWQCIKRGSPSLWRDFESDLARTGEIIEAPVTMAVVVQMVEGNRSVGLAYVNSSNRQLGACQFVDDEHFCHLETALIQLGGKECVIIKEEGNDSMDRRRLMDVLARCNILVSERPKASFATKALDQDVGRLLKGSPIEAHRPVLERQQAASALAGVLGFAEILADSSNHGKFVLELYDTGRYMRLDSAAQRALSVMKSRVDSSDSFSLYGLMNRNKTAMGKRLLKVWLKQPLVNYDEIKARHDVVEALVNDTSLRTDLQTLHLRGLPDIERLARKLERKTATLSDLCQLYRASSRLPLLENVINEHTGPHAEYLKGRFATPLAEAHDADHLTKFEELLEAAVDLDRIPDEYLISPTYDEALQELQAEKIEVENQILELAEEAAKDLGLVLDKTIKLEWHKMSNQRLRCLRITAKEEKTVRKKLQAKYIELETRKDGMKFTNRQMRVAAERLQALSAEYDSKQAQLVSQVISVASTFCEVWDTVSCLLAELDVLTAFADLAASAPRPYVRPTIVPADQGNEIVLKGCRHPCVEVQEGVDFIPNDVDMKKGESWFQIITGPNMGGKSTFIRQVGVCVLMAQVGSFVPCDEASIALRDCIFARVGAGDCQMRGVSTFMAEMLETAAIIKGATAKSLVIIDELGRGTSTWDGMGLAWAISEHLMANIGAATLFATHFHELTSLTGPTGVKNLHVKSAIDGRSGGLTMLYQVHEGSCDQSFGIHVAEFARFPAEVVELAKKKAAELEDFHAEKQNGKENSEGSRKRKTDTPALKAALLEFAAQPVSEMTPDQLQYWKEKLDHLSSGSGSHKKVAAEMTS